MPLRKGAFISSGDASVTHTYKKHAYCNTLLLFRYLLDKKHTIALKLSGF